MNAMQEYMNSVYASPYGAMRKKLKDNGYIGLIIRENCLYDDELCVQCEIPYEVAQHIVGKEV